MYILNGRHAPLCLLILTYITHTTQNLRRKDDLPFHVHGHHKHQHGPAQHQPHLAIIHEHEETPSGPSPGEAALWRMNVMLGKVVGPVLAGHVDPSLAHGAWRAWALRVGEMGRVAGTWIRGCGYICIYVCVCVCI